MVETAIFLAEGFEEVEALTVVDLLRRAGFSYRMISIDDAETVTGSHGIEVRADERLSDIHFDMFDMLILPGGMPGTKHLAACRVLTDGLREFYRDGGYISAICAAPTVFGSLGLLEGKRACCYPGMEDGLKGAVVTQDEVTKDGNIITSRGLGTAIPFALKIIEALGDPDADVEMAKKIVYRQ